MPIQQPAPKTTVYLSAFPYEEVQGFILEAQAAMSNLEVLLETVADLCEGVEETAREQSWPIRHDVHKIWRLLWCAIDERKRIERSIFDGEGALLGHIEYREAA